MLWLNQTVPSVANSICTCFIYICMFITFIYLYIIYFYALKIKVNTLLICLFLINFIFRKICGLYIPLKSTYVSLSFIVMYIILVNYNYARVYINVFVNAWIYVCMYVLCICVCVCVKHVVESTQVVRLENYNINEIFLLSKSNVIDNSNR